MNTWNSRRGESLGADGAVSCDQPLAAYAGVKVLEEGGTAADAAVAVAAALGVLQPATCGLGGDLWALYYEADSKRVHCLNGNGRTPAAFTLPNLTRLGFAECVPMHHAVCTSVPGAPSALCQLHDRFGNGNIPLRRLFEPAITLARNGFPVSEFGACIWRCGQASVESMKRDFPNSAVNFDLDPVFLNLDRRTTPKAGQVFRNPHLANTFEELANGGPDAFYKDGRIAKAIIDCQNRNGGLMTLEDLATHKVDFVEPAKIRYVSDRLNGLALDIYEPPLNSQAIVTLEALQILSKIGKPQEYANNPQYYYHALIDSLKYSFADLSALWRQSEAGIPPAYDHLLRESHAIDRAKSFNRDRASILSGETFSEDRPTTGDTTYFCVSDKHGNGCSMVYSNYCCFGTGYVPEGCGFTLNNRAYHFWENCHRRFAPSVRPFSSLMAGVMTHAESGDLAGLFGCMGGNNQPQGHLQILLNLLEFNHSPQQALNRPRVMIDFDYDTLASKLNYEEGIPDPVIASLRAQGHNVSKTSPMRNLLDRNKFGRGNVITCGAWWDAQGRFAHDPKVYWAASDPRGDGVALVL